MLLAIRAIEYLAKVTLHDVGLADPNPPNPTSPFKGRSVIRRLEY